TLFLLFFFLCSRDFRDLHSFPTRRSSDLVASRQLPVRFTTALGSIGVERVFDALVMLGLMALAIASPSFPAHSTLHHEGIEHARSEEHTSELQSRFDLVCRLLLEKKKKEQ